MNWFQRLFGYEAPLSIVEKVVYKTVVLDGPQAPRLSEKEARDSITALAAHPGFIELTRRMYLQHQVLKTKLCYEKQTSTRNVHFLQAGIYWSNWLRQEVARATTKVNDKTVDPFEEELLAFQAIDAQIERVG
jgi:hypothetical protein